MKNWKTLEDIGAKEYYPKNTFRKSRKQVARQEFWTQFAQAIFVLIILGLIFLGTK